MMASMTDDYQLALLHISSRRDALEWERVSDLVPIGTIVQLIGNDIRVRLGEEILLGTGRDNGWGVFQADDLLLIRHRHPSSMWRAISTPPTAQMLTVLASIYADHPDYDETWRI